MPLAPIRRDVPVQTSLRLSESYQCDYDIDGHPCNQMFRSRAGLLQHRFMAHRAPLRSHAIVLTNQCP
eukprot:13680960-Heterocapsa_arctica.AAC.1